MADDPQNKDDKFGPEAIAARIAGLGKETEDERAARVEEEKLLARRGKQKTPLEEAASRRLSKIGEAAVKRPAPLKADLSEAQAASISRWLSDNRPLVTAVVGGAVVAAAVFAGWSFWQDKRTSEASALLGEALADDHGSLAPAATADEDDDKATQPPLYPAFKTEADRRQAALGKYREVEKGFSGSGAAIVSRLSEAALLLDARDADGAKAAYQETAASPLAKADAQVRGRALEGEGFADELLADKDDANRGKHLDDAMKAFKALEGVGSGGFKELGMYHQARIAAATGDKAKAIDLLKDVNKRVEGAKEKAFSYLRFVTQDRLRELDPTALPPKAPKGPAGGAGAGGVDMSDPKIQELIRQLQEGKGGGGGGAPPPVMPVPPAPAGSP